MFGEIGFDTLLMLLVMFLLLFGAKRIPEIGRSLGKGIREFKGVSRDSMSPRTWGVRGGATPAVPPRPTRSPRRSAMDNHCAA